MKAFDLRRTESRLDFGSGRCPRNKRRHREIIEDGQVPVVFWVEDLDQGEEVALEENVHLTRPENFNQLRDLLARLLDERSGAMSSPQNEL